MASPFGEQLMTVDASLTETLQADPVAEIVAPFDPFSVEALADYIAVTRQSHSLGRRSQHQKLIDDEEARMLAEGPRSNWNPARFAVYF